MGFIYTLGVRLYYLVVWFFSPFNPKAKKWIQGRRELWDKLPAMDVKKQLFWFHCASLGEFDMALPIMTELKNKYPDGLLLTTFFSPSGMDHFHMREHNIDIISYLPVDTPSNMKRFIRYFNPSAIFIVKYEFWSNMIFEAKIQKIKVFSLCTVFHQYQRFFKWYGGFFRRTLGAIDFFYVQNQTSVDLLENIGMKNALLVGDTRFDRVLANSKRVKSIGEIEFFLQGNKAWVFGSTWPEDEYVLSFLIKHFPEQKIILAPHDITEAHLVKIERLLQGRTCRFSSADNTKQIIILDTIGYLINAYAYGELAFVGGGFSGKLHNILEPSVFGLPVIFGPKYDRFPEAEQFILKGIGFSIQNEKELLSVVNELNGKWESIKVKAKENILFNTGVANRISQQLTSKI